MLVPDMLFELAPRPAGDGAAPGGRAPGLDALLSLGGLEAERDVPQAEHAAGAEQLVDSLQREGLPEIGQVMEGVTRVDEIDRLPWCS